MWRGVLARLQTLSANLQRLQVPASFQPEAVVTMHRQCLHSLPRSMPSRPGALAALSRLHARALVPSRVLHVARALLKEDSPSKGPKPLPPKALTSDERCVDPSEVYPYEKSVPGEFLPVREPGNFPDVAINEPSNGAATIAAKPTPVNTLTSLQAGAELAAEGQLYDPLRDGPLRYLGYTNECGCV